MRRVRGLNKDTIRAVLSELERVHVVLCRRPYGRRTLYRISPTVADPTSPGYCREIDVLLKEPFSWVEAHGIFWRVGRENGVVSRIQTVPTFPHHFAKHVWMRGALHAFNLGLLLDNDGWDVVARRVRQTPLEVLYEFYRHAEFRRDTKGPAGPPHGGATCKPPDSAPRKIAMAATPTG
jgi:hypothetical protein